MPPRRATSGSSSMANCSRASDISTRAITASIPLAPQIAFSRSSVPTAAIRTTETVLSSAICRHPGSRKRRTHLNLSAERTRRRKLAPAEQLETVTLGRCARSSDALYLSTLSNPRTCHVEPTAHHRVFLCPRRAAFAGPRRRFDNHLDEQRRRLRVDHHRRASDVPTSGTYFDGVYFGTAGDQTVGTDVFHQATYPASSTRRVRPEISACSIHTTLCRVGRNFAQRLWNGFRHNQIRRRPIECRRQHHVFELVVHENY